mmetsp:Transcript_60690/g.125591  ORF Transcript_60690/g.125591 Transcript_60690/m.125591 type:complete len:123 (-) Transcript_60690:8-376(-)
MPGRGDCRSPTENAHQSTAMRTHPLFGPDLGDDDPDSRIDVDELEQSAGVYSSMDSAAWKTSATHSGPVPPDRRLHERHILKMDKLWEDVAQAPRAFEEIVSSRRSSQLVARSEQSTGNMLC